MYKKTAFELLDSLPKLCPFRSLSHVQITRSHAEIANVGHQ